jgi:hypothetical protein
MVENNCNITEKPISTQECEKICPEKDYVWMIVSFGKVNFIDLKQ